MRSAVLVHSCNLQTPEWNKLVWGEGVRLGRLPTLFRLFIEEKPDVVVFGSGNSRFDGKSECLVTYNHLLAKKEELKFFPQFAGYSDDMINEYLGRITIISYLDTESKNTQEELNNLAIYLQGQNIQKVYLISSPFHLPRCIYLATKTNFGDRRIYGVPSETDLDEPTVIFESPHKPEYTLYKAFYNKIGNNPKIKYPLDFDVGLSTLIKDYCE